MRESVRVGALFFLAAVVVAALVASLSFGTLPRADFTFANGSEPKTLDPHLANGQPEGRLAYALYEGLYRKMPLGLEWDSEGNLIQPPEFDDQGNTALGPVPAVAQSHEVSADQRTYTFHLRADAKWSDGSKLTSDDFAWSWRRLLHPETASQYATHLHYVVGARGFNQGLVRVGQRVEAELDDRLKPSEPFPQGTVVKGQLIGIETTLGGTTSRVESLDLSLALEADDFVVYEIEAATGDIHRVARGPGTPSSLQKGLWVLPDFDSEVGIRAIDELTLEVELEQPTSFFLEIVAFYSLCPVQRACIERHGDPEWTKPGNLVSNGPFVLELRRIRDRIRLQRNPHYWNERIVKLNRVDVLSIEKETTALNAYLNGQIDWCTLIPTALVPQLAEREDFIVAPQLTTYFYRFNTTKPPFDDPRVRKALALVIDREQICQQITGAGEKPCEVLCPPGMRGYQRTTPDLPAGDLEEVSRRDESDPQRRQLAELLDRMGLSSKLPLDRQRSIELKRAVARQWLADAGYGPQGRPLPRVELLYNTADNHRSIAEFIQQQWRNQLDVDVELVNAEWGTYLSRMRQMDFDIVRGGWIGDYQDPQSFLELWTTGNENNHTGWSNGDYDRLVFDSVELPAVERMTRLQEAESLVVEQLPFLPVYTYVSRNLVDPRYSGWYPNCEDVHPIHLVYRRGKDAVQNDDLGGRFSK